MITPHTERFRYDDAESRGEEPLICRGERAHAHALVIGRSLRPPIGWDVEARGSRARRLKPELRLWNAVRKKLDEGADARHRWSLLLIRDRHRRRRWFISFEQNFQPLRANVLANSERRDARDA